MLERKKPPASAQPSTCPPKVSQSLSHTLRPQTRPSRNLVFFLKTVGNREQTDGRGPADRTLPGTSIVCHVTRVSPPGLGGFSALSNQQEGSWKRVQSAGTSPSQRDVLYCSRPTGQTSGEVSSSATCVQILLKLDFSSKTVNSGRYVSNKVPGLDRLRFGPAFLRLDLDRCVQVFKEPFSRTREVLQAPPGGSTAPQAGRPHATSALNSHPTRRCLYLVLGKGQR